MFGASWRQEETIADHVIRNAPLLKVFTELSQDAGIDVFVMCLDDKRLGASLENLKPTVKAVMQAFEQCDPQAGRHPRPQPACKDWRFFFNGEPMHLIVLAPCYSMHNSRYGFGDDATYFLFFSRHSFSRRHANNSVGVIQPGLRHQIRHAYAASGRAYDIYIAASEYNALKVIKPQNIGDPAIRWWQ